MELKFMPMPSNPRVVRLWYEPIEGDKLYTVPLRDGRSISGFVPDVKEYVSDLYMESWHRMVYPDDHMGVYMGEPFGRKTYFKGIQYQLMNAIRPSNYERYEVVPVYSAMMEDKYEYACLLCFLGPLFTTDFCKGPECKIISELPNIIEGKVIAGEALSRNELATIEEITKAIDGCKCSNMWRYYFSPTSAPLQTDPYYLENYSGHLNNISSFVGSEPGLIPTTMPKSLERDDIRDWRRSLKRLIAWMDFSEFQYWPEGLESEIPVIGYPTMQ